MDGRVGRDDRAGVRRQQIARVLGGEQQRPVVLPDSARQSDDEAAHRRVVEEQAELVHDEESSAVAALDSRPESFREQEVDGRDHLLAELAHPEDDEGRVEVHVGRRGEHATKGTVHPAPQHGRRTAAAQPPGDIPEQGLPVFVKGRPDGRLDIGSLGLVQVAADDGDEVDRVRNRGAGRLLAVAGALEDVQSVPRSEREPDVFTSHCTRERAVLMLGVENEDLDPLRERTEGQRGHQVRLPGSGVTEDADVRVCVAAIIEGVDQDRPASRGGDADDETVGLCDVGVEPGEEGAERTRVENPGEADGIHAGRQSGQSPSGHLKGEALDAAHRRACGLLETARGFVERLACRQGQRQVECDPERALLAGGEAALQVLRSIERPADEGVVGVAGQDAGAHPRELALEVLHDPTRRQRRGVPREVDGQAGRH